MPRLDDLWTPATSIECDDILEIDVGEEVILRAEIGGIMIMVMIVVFMSTATVVVMAHSREMGRYKQRQTQLGIK